MATATHHNGSLVLWTSHKGRKRLAEVVTSLKAAPHNCIVRIKRGLPGEAGQYRLVPPRRLAKAESGDGVS